VDHDILLPELFVENNHLYQARIITRNPKSISMKNYSEVFIYLSSKTTNIVPTNQACALPELTTEFLESILNAGPLLNGLLHLIIHSNKLRHSLKDLVEQITRNSNNAF